MNVVYKNMTNKQKINKTQWTKFWNNLSVYVAKKPSRFLKRYRYSQDFAKLRRIGVDQIKIDLVKTALKNYRDPEIQFHRFTLFFRRDYETVKLFTGTKSASESFLKLFRKFHYNSFSNANKELRKRRR